jgi:hypothetical protein
MGPEGLSRRIIISYLAVREARQRLTRKKALTMASRLLPLTKDQLDDEQGKLWTTIAG